MRLNPHLGVIGALPAVFLFAGGPVFAQAIQFNPFQNAINAINKAAQQLQPQNQQQQSQGK